MFAIAMALVTANSSFAFAFTHGPLSVTAVLASMFSVVNVLRLISVSARVTLRWASERVDLSN